MKTKNKIIIILVVYVIFLAIYAHIPDFEECHSRSIRTDNSIETTLDVVVHKAHYNKYQYELIAEKHTEINGYIPDKLTLRLFYTRNAVKKGKKPYRTVVFDNTEHLRYIILDY